MGCFRVARDEALSLPRYSFALSVPDGTADNDDSRKVCNLTRIALASSLEASSNGESRCTSMSAFLRADDSAHTINSNLARRRVKSWEHNFDLNFRRKRRVLSSKYEQPAQSDIGATTYLAMLLCLSPSEKNRHRKLESAECPPPVRTIHKCVPVDER